MLRRAPAATFNTQHDDDDDDDDDDGRSVVRLSDGAKVQHFACAEGAGSFIKPKMLTRGETFGDVMRRR